MQAQLLVGPSYAVRAAGYGSGVSRDPKAATTVEITLQELLDEIARDGGDLAALLRRYSDEGALTPERIAELRTEATTMFTGLRTSGNLSEADVATLESLADAMEGLAAEDTHLTEAAAAAQARVDEIAARAGIDATAAPAEGEGDDADAEGDGEGGEAGPGTADAPPADAPPADAPPADAPPVDEQTPEQLAAAANRAQRRRVDLAAVARRVRRPEPPAEREGERGISDVLVAAAGVTGMEVGTGYNGWEDLGRAIENRMVGYANGRVQGRHRNGIAVLRKEFDPSLVASGENDNAVLDHAVDESRLPGGSLLAAAGWCAPSEQTYDLCDLPCAYEGLASFPEIVASRGGIRWTEGLDFCDIYNSPGFFHFTEAQMAATPRPDKPCMEIPCPDFSECRLDVDGLCVTGDILQRRGYPETVAQFTQGVLCAHAHKMNAWKLQQVVAGSVNDGIVGSGCSGATASILEAIELEVEAYKYRRRSSRATTLEMLAPYWVRGVIRADLSRRNGVELLSVSDEQINQWFTQRGVRVDWVYDWQDLTSCALPGPDNTIAAWPTEVEFIIYEAGTWVAATLDVITLDTIYDSTLLRQNKYTQLFTEEGICMIRRCNQSRRFTVPICADGSTGAQISCDCSVAGPFLADVS
jgi:hypothetical protein